MNNCHGNNSDNNKGNKHKGHLSHMLMMILCCGAPMLLLFLITILGRSNFGISGFFSRILPFLCPLMMLLMLPMMLKKDKGNKSNQNHCENKQVENKYLE
jgi:hypothetical protein